VQDWIKQRLPVGTHDEGMYVPGPSGDQICLRTLAPNKFIRLAIDRWRSRRKALKKTLKLGRNEAAVVRRLRSKLNQVRGLEQRNFEKAHQLGKVRSNLAKAQEKEMEVKEVANEREKRIAETEEKIRALTRELQELRSSHPADEEELSSLHQETVTLLQAGYDRTGPKRDDFAALGTG
jgi:chromosome segregation ATPase